MSEATNQFIRNLKSSFKFKILLCVKLPLAALVGIKITSVDELHCSAHLKYKWLNKNPFNTTYWAVLGMGAELCSGLLLMMHSYKKKPGISMYVTGNKAYFTKRALGKTTFICNDGERIKNCIEECIRQHSSATFDCVTYAYNQANELVAEFTFTWSIKAK